MNVLMHGYGVQDKDWHVVENEAAGFSRVYYITGGDVTYCDIKSTIQLKVGYLYVFPSNAQFEISHNPDNPICCLWFHFDFFPSFVTELIEFQVSGSLKNLLHILMDEANAMRVNCNFYRHLENALYSFIFESGKLLKTSAEILNWLKRIRKDCFESHFSIKEVSMDAGYTTEHFIRAFNKALNITPYQYVLELRMSTARMLLIEGKSINHVAEFIGYTDIKSFSHAFKQKFGISPSEFKKQKPIA